MIINVNEKKEEEKRKIVVKIRFKISKLIGRGNRRDPWRGWIAVILISKKEFLLRHTNSSKMGKVVFVFHGVRKPEFTTPFFFG